MWIAARDENSLCTLGQVDEYDRHFGNRSLDVGNIVDAGLRIQQMGSGHVRFAALKREQTAQAADIGGGNLELRVTQFQLIFQHANRQIMTTGAENRIFDVCDRPQQLDLGLLARIQSLDETRYA